MIPGCMHEILFTHLTLQIKIYTNLHVINTYIIYAEIYHRVLERRKQNTCDFDVYEVGITDNVHYYYLTHCSLMSDQD